MWHALTGGRLIGLTLSENAARVMTTEGLPEAYNIAQFLGKCPDSDRLRHPVHVGPADKLVIDEAGQVGTADLALIQQAAGPAGVLAVGDPAQLGPVEAGGWFTWFASELGAAELSEVRRFASPWEAHASLQLRRGDKSALAAYDAHGRIRAGDREAMHDKAALAFLADFLAGKDSILLAGSNAEAADLARRVQDKLIRAGRVQQPQFELADGNRAGIGDLVRARENAKTIDAGGQPLANRDVLRIEGRAHGQVQVRRQVEGGWSDPFLLPERYLADHGELGYAGNTHVAQGRTTDTAHLLVTGSLNRRSLYVGMTRGRQANTAYVATGEPVPGKEPELVNPEVVLAEIIDNDATELTATEAIRQAQEWSASTGHLASIWAAATQRHRKGDHRQQTERTPRRQRIPALPPRAATAATAARPHRTRTQRRKPHHPHRADYRRRPHRRQKHLRGPARAPGAHREIRGHTQHLGAADPGKCPSARPRGRQGDRRPDHRTRHAVRGKARALAHQPAGRVPRPRVSPGTAGLPPPGRIRGRLPGSRGHR